MQKCERTQYIDNYKPISQIARIELLKKKTKYISHIRNFRKSVLYGPEKFVKYFHIYEYRVEDRMHLTAFIIAKHIWYSGEWPTEEIRATCKSACLNGDCFVGFKIKYVCLTAVYQFTTHYHVLFSIFSYFFYYDFFFFQFFFCIIMQWPHKN